MLQLSEYCKNTFKEKKRIKSIGGRLLRLPKPMWQDGKVRTFEYKALNTLIQGSAADQIMEALIEAYDAGINVLFVVHDQICLSAKNTIPVLALEAIMKDCIKLDVPVIVDVDYDGGINWTEAGH